jgi:hypothetical protein
MDKRDNMTPYGLHKQGGPDPKTVRKILAGDWVRDGILDLIVTGLSNSGPPVSIEDIPDD